MADQSAIDRVVETLPVDAGAKGFNPERIGADLDSGVSPSTIALSFWRMRAAQTSGLVSVSESGSSRSLETIYKNAMEMVKYWEDQVAKEKEGDGAEDTKRRISFRRSERV